MTRYAFFSGARSEWYLLHPIFSALKKADQSLECLFWGGVDHAVAGRTSTQGKKEQFEFDFLFESAVLGDSGSVMSKSFALTVIAVSEEFRRQKIDALVVLGDRFETLAVVIAAHFSKVKVVHFHGGELTFGLIDDAVRHSITKFSQLHLTSTEVYRNRVIQLGEHPDTVVNCGSIGLHQAHAFMVGRSNFELPLKLNAYLDNLISVVFHPETLSDDGGLFNFNLVLDACHKLILDGYHVVFSGTNSDAGNLAIRQALQNFLNSHAEGCEYYENLGQEMFFSVVSKSAFLLGNSSSGILEAPYLRTPTINVGLRQYGRILGPSVYDFSGDKAADLYALCQRVVQDKEMGRVDYSSPYFKENSISLAIASILDFDCTNFVGKIFYDV